MKHQSGHVHVFIAGGTGAIGRPLIRQLVARKHRVTATTRSPAKTAALRALGAEPVVLDGRDASAVEQAVKRAAPDAVVHQMTALTGATNLRHFDKVFTETNRLRIQGTDNLLAAAMAANVPRFVAQSYTGWTTAPDAGSAPDEEAPFDPHPVRSQHESLAAIQHLERVVREAPLNGIVLRYVNLYGPGASDAIEGLVRKRGMPLIAGGTGVWSWVHVEDAAAATVAAVERGAPGIYNIADDEPAPVAEWLPYLANVLGAKPPLKIPAGVARVAVGEAVVAMMTTNRGASNAKAKRVLRWTLRWPSWRQGFLEGLAAKATPAGTAGTGRSRAGRRTRKP